MSQKSDEVSKIHTLSREIERATKDFRESVNLATPFNELEEKKKKLKRALVALGVEDASCMSNSLIKENKKEGEKE